MRSNIRKMFILVLLLSISFSYCFADSDTFNTGIYGIYGGVNGFGLDLFPLGTRWNYFRNVDLVPSSQYWAQLSMDFDFSFAEQPVDHRFAWDTGMPLWRIYEYEYYGNDKYFYPPNNYRYFNPYASFYLSLRQGLGVNQYSQNGPMFNLIFTFNSLYSMALEKKIISPDNGFVFMDKDGSYKAPFGPGTVIPGFPWLQDSRKVFNNRLEFDLLFYHNNRFGFNAIDGIDAGLHFEYGPHWLLNFIGMEGVTSDYWRVSADFSQDLNIVNIKQKDESNWLTLNLGHTNTLSYVGGNAVPEERMPVDRFRASFTDAISLTFVGPQFIASDCYSEFKITLNNRLHFGHIANEVDQSSSGMEFLSSLDGWFHIRLFGFMHLSYSCGYIFGTGIWESSPYWYQRGEVLFYVSV